MRKFLITMFILWQIFIATCLTVNYLWLDNIIGNILAMNKAVTYLLDPHCKKESQTDAR